MKRSKVKGLIAVLLTFAIILPALYMPSLAAGLRAARTVPEGYNAHDYNKLAAFLEIADANGIRNGEKLCADYDPDDPETWIAVDPDSGDDSFEWTETDKGLRVAMINLRRRQLVGQLDLDGCEELTELVCSYNSISELIVTGCCELMLIECGVNRFKTLDLSENEALFMVDCISEIDDGTGSIQSITLPHTSSLEIFSCYNNNITEIDISGCTGLMFLECTLNPLEHLDISNNTELISVSCNDCRLTELSITNNPNLHELDCEDNRLQSLIIEGADSLENLSCFNNELETLDLSECPSLAALSCCGNRLTELDLSHNPLLSELFTGHLNPETVDNKLTELDLSAQELVPINDIRSRGFGNIVFNCIVESEYYHMQARQCEGWLFDGWYNENGELLSTIRDYEPEIGISDVFIARFIPDGVHAFYGDIDGNGQVTISDAIYALRFAMGIMEPDCVQSALADVDEDWNISINDAVSILRMAMGLI